MQTKLIKLKRKISLGVALLVFITLISVSVVNAPWSTLGTGYAITTNYHGIDVPPSTPVTATAGTLDSRVVNVTFRWHFPNETVAWEDIVDVWTNTTKGQWNNGTEAEIRYAQSTLAPYVIGDWGIQAFFQDSEGNDRAGLKDVIKIRAESFNAVPEIPLGTIGAAATMIIALTLFALKKKKAVRTPHKF